MPDIVQNGRSALLSMLPKDPIEQCYYVTSTYSNDEPGREYGFCRKHADMVARITALVAGEQMHIAEAWAGSDRAERCAWHRCNVALDSGGLTAYGITNALAHGAVDPDRVHVYPAELVLAYQSMSRDDARWNLWIRHAKRLIRRRERAARRLAV